MAKMVKLETPYTGISYKDYLDEKRRLQIELLNIQNHVIENKIPLVLVFEGRDAAGKGSTIKRFTENLMNKHYRIIELGIPSKKESKYWFHRYYKHFPEPGEIVFFDRSWYNRAIIEPTMGYCSRPQYEYFMNKVLRWEEELIKSGVTMIKFYLSVNEKTQLYRFEKRQSDPLKFWKYSENDHKVRKKWDIYTRYKEQMFRKTSSDESPWVIVNANVKREARLTAMLYLVNYFNKGRKKFVPLLKEDILPSEQYNIVVDGVKFDKLDKTQYLKLKELITSR